MLKTYNNKLYKVYHRLHAEDGRFAFYFIPTCILQLLTSLPSMFMHTRTML